ncbi:hypothetical protein WAK64_09665 [Bacillus spongiae]|uniref:YodL-like protein n=1 Tax=Bacillus spongiae TaxID=2683610 RepID=A0ABU8HDW3_9BACI
MPLLEKLAIPQFVNKLYDITIFQTPHFGQKKGYLQVYRLKVKGSNHDDILYEVFRMFNVGDLIPKDYTARYIQTGDIIFIDEGKSGHHYYRLETGGWKSVNRVHIR